MPLLVFEAADCLMAIAAAEVGHLERVGRGFPDQKGENPSPTPCFDLGEYFSGRRVRWAVAAMGARHAAAWLRVRRVIDVVPVRFGADADAGAAARTDAARVRSSPPASANDVVSVAGPGAIDRVMNPIDTSAFVGKFVEEARDRLKALGAALLRLEQTPGAPTRSPRPCARRTASRDRR